MSSYKITGAIQTYDFIKWEGPRPQFVKQHMLAYRKPGADGIAALQQGLNGDQFQVALTAVFQSKTDLLQFEAEYRINIGQIVDIEYENTSWRTRHSTDFVVMNVTNREAKKQAISTGPTFCLYEAWHLVTDWLFIPVISTEV